MDTDPSEAAESEQIIPSLLKYFPDAQITKTGEAVYHTALNDVLANFDEEDDILLGLLIIIDELLAEMGENQYATALEIKE